jgi:hypothetical protein
MVAVEACSAGSAIRSSPYFPWEHPSPVFRGEIRQRA